MNLRCCPNFDRLVNELIEAYRHEAFCPLAGTDVRDDVKVVHLAMAEHRNACPLCREEGSPRPIEKAGAMAAKGPP